MGCWNGTCMLTNTPVFHGDEVYMFLLQQKKIVEDINLCYPNGFWEPLPFYIEGEYNDYGAVEDHHGPLIPTILTHIHRYLIEMEVGDNEFHDIAVKKEEFNLEVLHDADHENRLFIKSPLFGEPYRMKHVIIRKNVLDSLLQRYVIEYTEYNREMQEITYHTLTFNEIVDIAKSFLSEIKAMDKDDWKRYDILECGKNLFCKYLPREVRYSGMSPQILLIEAINDNNDELAYAIMYQLCVFTWLSTFMSAGRRIWSPQSGAGSQDQETKAQELLAHLILEESKIIHDRWDEDDEDN